MYFCAVFCSSGINSEDIEYTIGDAVSFSLCLSIYGDVCNSESLVCTYSRTPQRPTRLDTDRDNIQDYLLDGLFTRVSQLHYVEQAPPPIDNSISSDGNRVEHAAVPMMPTGPDRSNRYLSVSHSLFGRKHLDCPECPEYYAEMR